MRLISPLLVFVLALGAFPAAAQTIRGLTLVQQRSLEQEARLIVDLLQNHHYTGKAFRDLENSVLLGQFLSALDPQGLFFTTEDATFIQRRFGRSLKTVYLYKGDLRPAEEIYGIFRSRVRSRMAWVDARLARSFDFSTERETDPPWTTPAADAAESDRRWEQLLAERVLAAVLSGHEPAAARAWVRQSLQAWGDALVARDFVGVREVFLDAIIRAFDPHSGYFSAQTAQAFADEMDSAVSGIGLDVRLESRRCIVTAIHPGGPADLHSDIRSGDELTALKDEAGTETDIRGRSLEEIAGLIRGQPGTTVTLSYLRAPETAPRQVALVRARVIDAAHRARGGISILSVQGRDRAVGVIVLPQFYKSDEPEPLTSAAADVREILQEMVARGIDALVLDLRDNPGGALSEALAVGGIFLEEGVALHSRASGGNPETHVIRPSRPTYTGPLVVLASRRSASASEILAGLLQHHRRAVVVGAATTFGKGSVQSFVELDKLTERGAAMKWGMLRLTSQLYFLPDGSAVQRRGVAADLVLPSERDEARAEADVPGALPSESLGTIAPAPASAQSVTPGLIRELQDALAADLQALPEWELWRQEHAAAGVEPSRSLHRDTRQREWDRQLAVWTELADKRRKLERELAYHSAAVRLPAVAAQLAAHAARHDSATPTATRAVQLEHDHLVLRGAPGVQLVPLRTLRFAHYAPHAAVLAEAWSRAAGIPISRGRMFTTLQQLTLLDPVDGPSVLQVFAEPLASEEAARASAEAVLARIAELDGDLVREFPALDVPLREAQRMAALWSASLGSAP